MANRISSQWVASSREAAHCPPGCPFVILVAEEIINPVLRSKSPDGEELSSVYQQCDCVLHGRFRRRAEVPRRPEAKRNQVWFYSLEDLLEN